MQLNYGNKILINIPFKIINFSSNKIIINLTKNLNYEDKEILWNVDDITKIKININKNNYELLNDYIYKFNIINYDKTNIYYINKNKIFINDFSKKLNSILFINNLYS